MVKGNCVIESLVDEPRGQRLRERYQPKGLTMARHVRCKSVSEKQQREMAKFCVLYELECNKADNKKLEYSYFRVWKVLILQ